MPIERRRKQNKDRWPEIVKDYKSGLKIKDIMEKYSISKAGIYYILEHTEDKL